MTGKAEGLWPPTYDEVVCASTYVMLVAYFGGTSKTQRKKSANALGFRIEPDGRKDGPDFSSLANFFRSIGLDVETTEVKWIRELRHWVAHRRSSIETHHLTEPLNFEALRQLQARRVTVDQIREDASILDDVIRAADPTMWQAAWLGKPSEKLQAIVGALRERAGAKD